MPLILAVDRDRRQTTQLASLVHKRLNAELVHAATAKEGLEALAGRVPDLILTSSLISPKEDGVLAGHLRELGARAAHVQTLTIPVLKASRQKRSKSGVLSKLRRDNTNTVSGIEGCEPEAFADEIGLYLARAAEEQQMRAERDGERVAPETVTAPMHVAEQPIETAEAAVLQEFNVPDVVENVADVVEPIETIDVPSPIVRDTDRPAAPSLILREDERPKTPSLILREDELPKEPPLILPAEEQGSGIRDQGSGIGIAAATPSTSDPGSRIPDPIIDPIAIVEPAVVDPVYATAVDMALSIQPDPIVEPVASPPEIETVAIAEPREETKPATFVRAPEDEPSLPVPIERLMELFADFQPQAQETIEPVITTAAPDAVDKNEPVVAPVERSLQAPRESAPPPANVLNEEELVQLGEAAWKASFRAAFLKDLGIGANSSSSASGKSESAAAPKRTSATKQSDERATKQTEERKRPEPKAKAAPAAPAPNQAARKDKEKDKENRANKKPGRGKTKGPVQDEWGLFDPEQCGFSALVDKLEEVTDPADEQPQAGTRVRLISY